MPSLQGYAVQTHPLPGGREVDVLSRPAEPGRLWVPGLQVAALTGYGHRCGGPRSVSDITKGLDPAYLRREPDPHRVYARTRIRSVALIAVEGLVQRTFHTRRPEYIAFCREFIEHVLPGHPDFVAAQAELVDVWAMAIERFQAAGRPFEEPVFRSAVAARDARLAASGPATEGEMAVDQPLPGLPDGFNGQPCPTYGTYENPEWVGAYVCDALALANPSQVLSRVPTEEKGIRIVDTLGGPQSMITVTEAGLYRLIATSRKAEAERFQHWLYHEVLPAIRRYGYYARPGAPAGPTAEELREALRALLREELPTLVEPAVRKAVLAHAGPHPQAELVAAMTAAVERLVEVAVVGREQLELSRRTVQLVLPEHQLFLSAGDYIEADGVAAALKRAPQLAGPSFGLVHCPDHGKASLWMKRLCRAERKKVAANAVARIIARDAGQEEPPLYVAEYRMKKLTREHAKVLMFNPPCWARCKQTFLPAGTPTLLFPAPRAAGPPAGGQAEEA
jgi:prophage antirepressor-like protein